MRRRWGDGEDVGGERKRERKRCIRSQRDWGAEEPREWEETESKIDETGKQHAWTDREEEWERCIRLSSYNDIRVQPRKHQAVSAASACGIAAANPAFSHLTTGRAPRAAAAEA